MFTDAPNTEMTPETVYGVTAEIHGEAVAKNRVRRQRSCNLNFKATHRIHTAAFRKETNANVFARMIREVKSIGCSAFRTSEQIWSEYRRVYFCYNGEEPLLDQYQ